MDEEVYKKKSRVLVCYNPDIMELKCKILDRKVEHIKKMVKDGENQDDIKMMISKYHLKKALEIDPVYHSRDDRIETHTVMVVFGYLLMSLLSVALNERKISYSLW